MVFSALRVGSRRESASSVEAFRASPALASVLMNLAGASSSLQNDSSDSALLRWSQACGGTTGLTLREAYDRLSASEREALRLGFGPLVEEWMALSQEGDPALFAEGLAGMARRFQQSGDAVRAGILWQFLSQGNGELSPRLGADFRARAAAEAGASRGEGPFGARFENLARTFAQQAADPTMIAGMGAAGIVAGTVRLGVLSRLAASPGANLFTRGMGASFTAATAAWAAEVPTFWATTRALHAVTSSRPLAWDRGTLLREIGSTALLLGLLKLGGAGSGALFNRVHGISTTSLEVTRLTGFTRMTQSVFPQLGMFGGIYADHLIEERLGWRPRSDGASRVFDSLATLFQFHVGGRLAGEALGPRYAETLRGLETRTRLLESPPLVSNVSGFGDFDGLFGQSPAWASVGGGTRPPRGGSGDPLDGISQMSAVKPERQAAVRARRVPDPKPSEERAVEPEVNHAALAQAFHATPAKDLDRFVKMNFERGSLARLALALEAEGFRPDLTPQDFQRAQSTLLALEGDFWLYLARERESVMPEKRWETFQKWQNELHPNDPAGFARLQKVARGVGLLDIFSFKTDGIRIKSRVRANQESADYFHDLSLVRDFLISRGFHRVEENNPRGIFLSNLLLKGDGNCVSLSLLFAHFAAMTGRPLQAGLLPRHFYLMGKEGAAIDSVFNYGITHSNAYKNRAIIPEQKALPAHAVLGVHLLNLGKSAMEGGNDARAINAFEHAQALLPRSPRAYLQLGQMAQSRNDFAAALAYYQQVYALHPTDAKGLNNLRVRAWERFQAGQYREAEAAFRRMNDINPQDLNALHGLQTTYQAMGLFAEAEGVGSLIELMKMDDGEP